METNTEKTLGQIAHEASNLNLRCDWNSLFESDKLQWEKTSAAVRDEVLRREGVDLLRDEIQSLKRTHQLSVEVVNELRAEIAALKSDPRLQCPLDGPGSHFADLAELRLLQSSPAEGVNPKLLDLVVRAAFMWDAQIGSGYFLKEMQSAICAARVQAEDDAKPVDEEWMAKNVPPEATDQFKHKYRLRISWHVYRDGVLGVWLNGELIDFATRGDVRRLLAALTVRS